MWYVKKPLGFKRLNSLILMPVSEFTMGCFRGSTHLALTFHLHKNIGFLDQLINYLWDTLYYQIIKLSIFLLI
jgi:hypothetical protein